MDTLSSLYLLAIAIYFGHVVITGSRKPEGSFKLDSRCHIASGHFLSFTKSITDSFF
jgi:hypothetical protein